MKVVTTPFYVHQNLLQIHCTINEPISKCNQKNEPLSKTASTTNYNYHIHLYKYYPCLENYYLKCFFSFLLSGRYNCSTNTFTQTINSGTN